MYESFESVPLCLEPNHLNNYEVLALKVWLVFGGILDHVKIRDNNVFPLKEMVRDNKLRDAFNENGIWL